MNLIPFQREHYARAALVKGLVLGHEQGLGKSFAAFCVPHVWRARRVLLVAPGDLHHDLRLTAAKQFAISLPAIKDMDDVRKHRLDRKAGPLRKGQMPKFYLTSYEALALNGADEWQPEVNGKGRTLMRQRERQRLIEAKALAKAHVLAKLLGRKLDFSEYMQGVGHERNGITCVWKPSLARELKQLEGLGTGFDCIVLDEATAIQGNSKTSRGVTLLNPEFRMLMTGTPAKNRLESIFTLAWWATGGHAQATSRWPYGPDGKEEFAKQHLEVDRFLTREEEKAAKENKSRSSVRIQKSTPRVCNVQRLWRLLAPVVLRLRKQDSGVDIAPKTIKPIEVAMGEAQATVYGEHLVNRPLRSADGGVIGSLSSLGMQLTNLRIAATCPDALSLGDVISNAHPERKRSWTPWTPKLAATLSLLADLLDQGEQILVGSPFTHFNETLHRLLLDASVQSMLLDGNTPPTARGVLAQSFKRGDVSVLIAGYQAMGRGHSFENCSHLIAVAYPWAYDTFAQYLDRIWRLNSPRPITVYPIITSGSIDERMRDLFADKSDTAQLMLDGKLFPETVEDMDPERLLAEAFDAFKAAGNRASEHQLEHEWPKLAKRLRISQQRYQEWHPPIVQPKVTAADIARAAEGVKVDPDFDFAVAKERLKQSFLNRRKPKE